MAITAEQVKELREKTQAGMMECKRALEEAGGDMEKACKILRERGAATLSKRDAKATSEGTIACYVHTGGKIGVMVELDCETDFVAKTEEFQNLAHDIAMQIAWSQPEYVSRQDIPAERLEQEREIHRQWALNQGKPEAAIPKIVEGRMEKFYATVTLMDQPFIKDEEKTIADLINEKVAKFKEKIVVRRFVRYRVGELG